MNTADMSLSERTSHAKRLRDQVASQIADEFEASGIEYTCGAVVMDFAAKRIVLLTDNAEFRPFLAHRFLEFSRIKRAAWDEVHKRWKARKQGN